MTHDDDGEEGYEVSGADKNLARAIYKTAVKAHTADDENIGGIHDDFDEGIARAYKNGDIVVRTEQLLQAHLWQMVNAESGRATARMVKDIVAGKTPLPMDEWLDLVITCGKLRRTTIRTMTPQDWDRIIEVRVDNAAKANQALADAKTAAGIGLAVLSANGTMQNAASAGVLPLVFPS